MLDKRSRVAVLLATSMSVTTALPVLHSGDTLDVRMAKLEGNFNELEFVDKLKKLAEEHHSAKVGVPAPPRAFAP